MYVANLGDSRAIISSNCGFKINTLSIDHRPNLESEKRRILEAGGKIIQVEPVSSPVNSPAIINRVFPGGLSQPGLKRAHGIFKHEYRCGEHAGRNA